MTFPTIHLNGTSAGDLACQLNKADIALINARTALVEATPNARDYYVQGPTAFSNAIQTHFERMAKITEVRTGIEKTIENIQEQVDAQEALKGRR